MTNSCRSSGVPRITSTYTVVAARSQPGPYTRADASPSPTMTASAIDRKDTSRVTTAARARDGREARAEAAVAAPAGFAAVLVRVARTNTAAKPAGAATAN